MNRKSIYIYTGIGVLVLIIYLVLIFLSFRNQGSQKNQASPTPFPSPTIPVVTSYPFEKINSIFDDAKAKKITDQNDILIRKQLIGTPGNKMKTIYETPNYRLQYVPKSDVFMIQILAANVASARQESISYLSAKGLSKNGICNLPIIFYSNWEQAELQTTTKRGSGMKFYPPPDGC